MSNPVTPYKNSKESKKQQVTSMFDTIAENYDHLNRVTDPATQADPFREIRSDL